MGGLGPDTCLLHLIDLGLEPGSAISQQILCLPTLSSCVRWL